MNLMTHVGKTDVTAICEQALCFGRLGLGEGAARRRVALEEQGRTLHARPERAVVEGVEPRTGDERSENGGIEIGEALGRERERGAVPHVAEADGPGGRSD